jgi:hypothetical protein
MGFCCHVRRGWLTAAKPSVGPGTTRLPASRDDAGIRTDAMYCARPRTARMSRSRSPRASPMVGDSFVNQLGGRLDLDPIRLFHVHLLSLSDSSSMPSTDSSKTRRLQLAQPGIAAACFTHIAICRRRDHPRGCRSSAGPWPCPRALASRAPPIRMPTPPATPVEQSLYRPEPCLYLSHRAAFPIGPHQEALCPAAT